MSVKDTARALFGSLLTANDAVQARLQDIVPEVAAEAKRSVTQGSMETASALFSGHSFVPYGPGQYTPSNEQQQQQQRGMER